MEKEIKKYLQSFEFDELQHFKKDEGNSPTDSLVIAYGERI